MALINCPKCGAPYVSDKTFSCPHCTFNVKQYLDDKAKEEALEAQRKREEEAERERAEKEAEFKKHMEEVRKKEIEEEPLPEFPVAFLVCGIAALILGIISIAVAQAGINILLTCFCLIVAVTFIYMFFKKFRVYKEAKKDPAKWKEDAYNTRMHIIKPVDDPDSLENVNSIKPVEPEDPFEDMEDVPDLPEDEPSDNSL